jgi:hypothetical protein
MYSLATSSMDVRVRSLLMPKIQQLQMSIAGRWFLVGVIADIAMRLRCCYAEYASGLKKIWAYVQDVWMLREESEEQAKRMLLPLLTLHRTFWSPGCYTNTPSTWQQTHNVIVGEVDQ